MLNINLYSCFNQWKYFNNIWLYSDPHFNDPDSKYYRVDYPGDDEQVRLINSKVGRKDLIIFLGDIGDINYIRQIRGYKVLIQGNHDVGASTYLRSTTYSIDKNGKLHGVDNGLFDEVYEGPLIINEKIILSHEYLDIPYLFNIHGHHHSKLAEENGLNCCAEHLNYQPISLKSVINSGVLKNIVSIHRETINKATERKLSKTK